VTVHITEVPDIGMTSGQAGPAADGGFGALRTASGNLPLRSMDVRATITAMVAGVEIVQRFVSAFDTALEATYIFPLPDRGAVTGLRMEADGRVIEGVLAERAQARRDYDAAVSAGRRAAIAEEERPDVFTMRVGNIAPGEEVTIRLTLTQPLPYEDGEIIFRFPLVVAPRYIPGTPLSGEPAGSGTGPDTDAVPDASRITPPVLLPGFPNPVALRLTADIDPAGLVLTRIRSSLHAVAQEAAPAGHTIVALGQGERLDRDLILRLAVADPAAVTSSLVLCPDPEAGQDSVGELGSGTFFLTVIPPASGSAGTPRDVAIVLDRSGSMAGWKIVAARRAAARIVDTLGSQDRLAVLGFDHAIEQPPELGGTLVPGTDRNRFRAVEFLAGLTARGGTELLAALECAADLLAPVQGDDQARQRVLVLVTDGQVGNENQIIGALARRLHGTRVHAVGIDEAVNAGFLTRLAAIGRGRCELVESQDQLDDAAAAIHRRIADPLVTGLTMDSVQLRVVPGTVAPARLPDLFDGAPVTISGRFAGACPDRPVIAVRGILADGSPHEQVLPGVVTADRAVTAIWARAYLRELEDRYTCAESAAGGLLDHLERQIIAASLRFGVLCRFTAFLAADSRVVTDGTGPHRVIQPVELPSGWDPMMSPAAPMAAGGVQLSSFAPGTSAVGTSVPATAAAARVRRASRKRHAPAAGVPDWVLDQIADEVTWLDTAGSGPALGHDMADLGTRLSALIIWLAGSGFGAEALAGFQELAVRLEACDRAVTAPAGGSGTHDDVLDDLRRDALRILGAFLRHARGENDAIGGGRTAATRPGEFWKRGGRAAR
jgi:Ca-activated chloride channel homolog